MKADIDIDVAPQTDKSSYGIRAIIYDVDKQDIRPHPSGFYLGGDMPVDTVTGMAAIDYEQAEEYGFIKVDLLTNTAYGDFDSKEELTECINKEPDWSLLLDEKVVKHLPHLSKHAEFVREMEPRSIDDLADVLALIRPGKQHLIDKYKENKLSARKNLYRKPKTGMYFKKSHAYAYAMMIIAVMNKGRFGLGIEWQ